MIPEREEVNNHVKFQGKSQEVQWKVLGSRNISIVMRKKKVDMNLGLFAVREKLCCYWGDNRVIL